jgi:sortase family protein
MTTSTPRRGLSRAVALLLTLAFAMGWAESGLVLARSTAEAGGAASGTTTLAEPRLDTAAAPTYGWLFALHERREDLAATPVVEARVATPVAQAKASTAKPKPAQPTVAAVAKATYTGRNHFWIPLLDMSYRVYPFECTRTRDPDNYMYRWGCAGTNNVYILGHAYGVMKPLHDLYVAGKLKVGMVAIYADTAGNVHWYRVTTWRVVDPTEAAWAIADQPVPSMTLQTCVGKDGQYRLNVRLVQFR